MAKKTGIEIDPVVVQKKVEMDVLLEKIKVVDYNLAEAAEVYQAQQEVLKRNYESRKQTYEAERMFLLGQLRGLFSQVPQAETKTQCKVTLLGGDVIVKKSASKLDYDKENLLKWAKYNKLEHLIASKVVENFDWSKFKEQLTITNDGIIDTETGELLEIEGLEIKHVDEEIVIKY